MLNQLMRYVPLSRLVRSERCDKLLEVGGGETGINIYLPGVSVVGVDAGFKEDGVSGDGRFRKIKGSALKLPFGDGSFPVVVSGDMLEHIAPADREAAIKELLRVGSGKIFLAFPVRETYGPWEEKLLKWYKFTNKETPDWLLDHMAKGLPSGESVSTFLTKSNVVFKIVPNENNLLHFLIMAAEASLFGKYVNYLAGILTPDTWDRNAHGPAANLLRLLLVPLRRLPLYLNFGSTVRKIFIIDKSAATSKSDGRSIAKYYDEHPSMISSPFGGVGTALVAENEYLTETLAALGFELRGKRVLDIGSGSGWFAYYCKDKALYYAGIDISPRSVELSKRVTSNIVQADAQSLPFEDGSFDCVFCIDSFEHIPDQAAAVNEFYRVLAKGGKLFLSVPNYSNVAGLVKKLEEFSGLYQKDSWAPFDYWSPQVLERFMTPKRVRALFAKAGFREFSVIGGKRDLLDGIFPWINHRYMPCSAALRGQFSHIQRPLERFYKLSLHNFWSIRK